MDDTAIADLLRYAAKLGVRLTGILPRRLPGRGYGIVATRDIEVSCSKRRERRRRRRARLHTNCANRDWSQPGETVLEVPTRALRTLATVPKGLSRPLAAADVSVHGILAAHLMTDGEGDGGAGTAADYGPWNAVLPTDDDVEAAMPLLWPTRLQELLPTPARDALERQQAKLQRDWGGVSSLGGAAGDSSARRRYTRAWLLVNSRTFYYTTPRSEAALPSHDDRIAMQPVADLFNHAADRGCRVAFAADGFAFAADQPYRAGDEVPISYGAHANDALLVEYGFVLGPAANRWDEASLDAVLLPRLASLRRDEPRAADPREDLADAGFLGRYMVDAATPGGCYRTQVALRRLLCRGGGAHRRAAWLQYVAEGGGGADADAAFSQAEVHALLRDCLGDMAALAERTLAKIERLAKANVGRASQRALLAVRWQQIEAMVARAVDELGAAEKKDEETEGGDKRHGPVT